MNDLLYDGSTIVVTRKVEHGDRVELCPELNSDECVEKHGENKEMVSQRGDHNSYDHRTETVGPLSPASIECNSVQSSCTPRTSEYNQHKAHCIAQEKENDPNLSLPSFDRDLEKDCRVSLKEPIMSHTSVNPTRNIIHTSQSYEMPHYDDCRKLESTFREESDGKSHLSTEHSPSSVIDLADSSILKQSDCKSSKNRDASLAYLSPKPIAIPRFNLHRSLQINLKQPVVDRCSFYTVVHDVNKEVLGMLQHDKYSMTTASTATQSVEDEYCVLLMAVEGPRQSQLIPSSPRGDECISLPGSDSIHITYAPSHTGSSLPENGRLDIALATIDEEMFLLRAISSRSPDEMSIRACPATFSEAMGEVEPTENRTQLWKPGRSWWEAKSGKNPWIEASSHNKRWRYLWPLIHYHKFLAKCIKKLKRHNIDVRSSLSPVSSFLREEVCAISEHLALVSHFTSEQWMEALNHFKGWHDPRPEEQERLRQLVGTLDLRKINEYSDVDSALLRNQIDESFLRAMMLSAKELDGEISASIASQSDHITHSTSVGSSSRVLPPTGRFKIVRNKSNHYTSNMQQTPIPMTIPKPQTNDVVGNINMTGLRREHYDRPPPPPNYYNFPPTPYPYIIYPPPPHYFQPSFYPYPSDMRMIHYTSYPGYNGPDVNNESMDYAYDFSFHSDMETSFLS